MPRILIITLALACCAVAAGQTFEVASVKPSDPNLADRLFPVKGGPGTADAAQVTYTNTSLRAMLYYAYGFAGSQIAGPSWLGQNKFDITAKIPPGTTKDQFTVMVQNLLADRFHLVVHREQKATPGYELVIGKNAPRLAKASDSGPGDPSAPVFGALDAKGYPALNRPGMVYPFVIGSNNRAIHLMARSRTLSDLAKILSGLFGHPIVDKTGLNDPSDFTLEFALESAEPSLDYERIPDALQHQLGLRLEPAKIPVEMLIVDSADRVPTEN